MKSHPITSILWLLGLSSVWADPASEAPNLPKSPPDATTIPLSVEILATDAPTPVQSPLVVSTPPTAAAVTPPTSASVDSAAISASPLQLAPPAQPVPHPPNGWAYDFSADVPVLAHSIETASRKPVVLLIRPPLLVPKTDGTEAVSLIEPGFSPALGVQQSGTTAALLADSMHQLESTANNLDTAISQLENLLLSLPAPQSPPATTPAPP